ncbi:unnamed protein product [Cuscuta campestris]|uniref:Uncharacterized protein n=1 Tax=Cuscuta campestris TaxID=132261 RepID=A0A484KDU5_9ASTE|nr:unnamed protein product [Cuscuta campestris]
MSTVPDSVGIEGVGDAVLGSGRLGSRRWAVGLTAKALGELAMAGTDGEGSRRIGESFALEQHRRDGD